MSKELISADPTTTLFQIAKMMEQGVGAILIKKDGVPAGIITDRDFAILTAANRILLDTPVENVASYPLKTISPDESVFDAAASMSASKIRKLVVVENGKVVGIITSTDIVNLVAQNKY
ncbi:CBS domain-containing protein [Nitrosopumilus sp. K4]|nr:CBS domain-containing protein [Nitrosopumilus sp. K4]